MANTLMFEVGVKEADNQLTELENRLKKIVSNYGKLELKVQVDGLKAFTTALENIGQSKGLDALQKRLDVLQVTLANAGMAGAKSMQEFEAAVKTNSSVADQYRKRIEELTNARNKFIENTEPWRKANERLTAFREDKNTLAVFAQEQVAIKNLEDAKARLGQANNQEAESYQKVTASIETLNAAANMLKTTLGSIDTNKGNTAQLVENFEKLHNELSAVVAELKKIDLSKLNFSGVNLDLSKVAGIGDLNSAIRGLEVSINEIINLFSKLSNAVKLDASSEIIKKMQVDADAAQKTIAELTEKMNNLAAAQKNVAETASKTGKSEQQIGDSQAAMFNRYNKLLADIQNIKREIVEVQRGTGGGGPFGDKLSEYYSAINQIRNVVREITSAPSVADAINKGMSSEMLAKLTSALAALKTNYKEVIADAKDFNKATDKGSSQAEARIRKLGMAFNELKNYMKANGGSEEMKRLQQEIQGAIRKMRDLMNAGRFGEAINVYERLSGLIRQAASATKEFEKAQHSVSGAVSQANSNLQHQSQILSDLKTMAMQYLSVWGAQSFINNIIELGGQLEQQRLSIGAILQDTAQANHLFSQIKDLAIKSPFGVQQLDAMSKQLSAYGFQYSELYEWTKRLADISAATGTSVDRLALALGHVRSEGALSGYTLRQFSMGNIPLLQKLSENLGKTKQEIRKMTRNKEIGYEDVLNVLKQLTDESGMFYKAQETMAQALNAKFKNLRDSFQIMYSEMAEGAPGDFLKGLATTLTDLSRQWQILMPMIGAAGAMWAMNRASAALVNVELAKMAKLTNANTLASSKYSVAQLRQIANWEKMPHAMVRARLALQGFRTSLLSLGKMIFSWPTAIFAAIEAITYMWAKQSRESEKAKEMTEVLTNTALESQKNLRKQLENISPYENGMTDSEMKTGIETMTEAIKNYGVNAKEVLDKVYGQDAEGRVMSMADRYKTLREELEKTEKVYKEMQRTAGGWEFGIEYTDGGWFDDDVQTDLTNYANAVKEYEDAFTTMTANYASAVNKALEQVKKASPEFKQIADKLNSDAERVKWLYENQGQYGGLYNMFKGALHREDANAGGGVLGYQLGDNLRSAEKEAMKELDEFFVGVEAKYKEYGYNFTEDGKHLSEEQVGNLLRQSKEWLEKHPEWENIYSVIWDKLNKRWGLPIVPEVEEVEEKLPKWLDDFQKELDGTGIKLTATMSPEQIIDEMKKAYDKAQTTINKLGPLAMTAKIDVVGLSNEDIEAYNNPLSPKYNPEMYSWLKQLKGAYSNKEKLNNATNKHYPGVKLEGMKKDGTHKAEKQSQENAKAVREQVRVIKEAADAFQYWREKVGDKGAWEHVQAEFGDVLKKIGITADNIENVRGHLKQIPQMKEYKAITDQKVKTEIDKEIAKENDQYIRKDFERDTEKWASALSRDIDELTRKWDIFNSVVSDTGDRILATRLSGIAPGATPADLKRLNISQFAGARIDFDSVLGMSDEQIDRYVETLGVAEDKIKAVQNGLKDWKKAQEDVIKSDIQSYTKWLGSLVDLESIRKRNQEEYNRALEETNRLLAQGVITQEEAERRRAAAATNEETKNWQATTMYSSLYNNSLAMAEGDFYAAYNRELASLNDQLKSNTITASDYAEKVSKLDKIMAEFHIQGFLGIKGGAGAYLSGGYQGLINYHRNRAKEKLANGDEEGARQEKETADAMEQAQKAAEQLTQVFQDLSSGADMLANLFDALGMEGAANAFGDAAGVLGGVASGASSLSAFGPWGMAVGGAIGGLTSIFQLSDKNHERRIQELKKEVTKIDNTLNTIKALRERELGYDNGNLRSQMAALYKSEQKTIKSVMGDITIDLNPAATGMNEYYSRYSGGNGYSQEYNALIETRKKYMEMYDEENSKKKKSQEALEEYKVKMAELDEQIMYYVEDLSKELWGIDFKSWANQISDALWTAFENGEDALEAFHDTAKDIVADVAKRMMTIGVLEPMFKDLEKALFGTYNQETNRYENGAIKYDSNGNINMQGSEKDVLEILGNFFGEGGSMEKNVEAAEQFYDWVEKITGIDFSSDSDKGTSTSIKNITEDTADLLASYLNAVRASTAKIEGLQAQYFPMYYDVMTRGNSSLTNIENHTAAIMRSNDAIQKSVDDLYRDFHGLRTSAWKMPIA